MPQTAPIPERKFDPKLRGVLAKHVREARAAQGISRPELAERSGISIRTLARIELATNPPDLDTLEQVAQGLGVPASNLLAQEAAQ